MRRLSSTAACNIRPDFRRMGARRERPIKLSDTGWKFNITSLFFRGAEHMHPFVSETTSTAYFEGLPEYLGCLAVMRSTCNFSYSTSLPFISSWPHFNVEVGRQCDPGRSDAARRDRTPRQGSKAGQLDPRAGGARAKGGLCGVHSQRGGHFYASRTACLTKFYSTHQDGNPASQIKRSIVSYDGQLCEKFFL